MHDRGLRPIGGSHLNLLLLEKVFVVYLCYLLKSKKAHVALLTSKAKHKAVCGESTLMSELDGHTLEARAAPFSEWLANHIGEIYVCLKDHTGKIETIWG